MARARGSSDTTAYAGATVLFVILFVFSLILAIVFYSRVGRAELAEQNATDTLRRFVSTDQESQQRFVVLAKEASKKKATVYKELNDEVTKLKALAGGNQGAGIEDIRKEWQDLVSVAGTAYAAEVRKLKAARDEGQGAIDKLNTMLAAEKKKAVDADAAKVDLARQYDQAKQQDEQKRADLRKMFQQHQTDYEKSLVKIQGDLGNKLAATQHDRDDKQMQVTRQKTVIENLREENKALKEKLARRERQEVFPKVVEYDGRIESMLLDERLVYIDLGSEHHVQPGLTLEVFGMNEVVKLDGPSQLEGRGKATLEVIDVSKHSSSARIVRQSISTQLMELDKVYNVAYDKDWIPAFFVHGQFDIDLTGQPSRTDRRRVQTMIRQWRGEVREKLTYEVDYLVLGVAPRIPVQPGLEEINPEVIRSYTVQKQRHEEYQDLIEQALDLEIPILHQNRFLTLIGYYQR